MTIYQIYLIIITRIKSYWCNCTNLEYNNKIYLVFTHCYLKNVYFPHQFVFSISELENIDLSSYLEMYLS